MKNNIPSFNPANLDDAWGALEQIIHDYLMNNLWTVSIVEVSAVNEDNTIDVRPVIRLQTTLGAVLPQQEPIFNVPIFVLKGGNCEISLPVAVGDKGLLLACKYDPSLYFMAHSPSTAASNQLFSLSNGVFLPLDFGYTPSGIMIRNGSTKVNVQEKQIILEAGENDQTSSLVLGPSSLTGTIQGSVIIKAENATIEANEVNLGASGGVGVARIGDSVVVGGVTGQITSGSAIVKSS